jgi:hypothetical protein
MIDEAFDEEQIVRTKFEALRAMMDERVTRLWAGETCLHTICSWQILIRACSIAS